jgi:hypothetical protein
MSELIAAIAQQDYDEVRVVAVGDRLVISQPRGEGEGTDMVIVRPDGHLPLIRALCKVAYGEPERRIVGHGETESMWCVSAEERDDEAR